MTPFRRGIGLILVLAALATFCAVRYQAFFDKRIVVDTASPEWKAREAALERARVFVPEELEASPAHILRSQTFPLDRVLRCTYVPKPITGTTPKFDCRLPDGEVVKVKYGSSAEVPAELAATRLLAVLGFAADHMSRVMRLECIGCPPHPFRMRQLAEIFFLSGPFERTLNFNHTRVFDRVAVERRFEGRAIEAGDVEGWQWSDLDRAQERRNATSRAEFDALRLMAVLLAHWDNKPSNQRLVCLDNDDARLAGAAECRTPMLMLQDLGSSFGPHKMNLRHWVDTPIWEPAGACLATMAALPYQGATFHPVEILEPGRLLLAHKFQRITETDLQALFEGAIAPNPAAPESHSDDISSWVDALQQKIRAISEHAPCPSGA